MGFPDSSDQYRPAQSSLILASLEGARPVIGLAKEGPPVLLVQFETDRTAGETTEGGHLTCNANITAGGEELPGEGHVVSLD